MRCRGALHSVICPISRLYKKLAKPFPLKRLYDIQEQRNPNQEDQRKEQKIKRLSIIIIIIMIIITIIMDILIITKSTLKILRTKTIDEASS